MWAAGDEYRKARDISSFPSFKYPIYSLRQKSLLTKSGQWKTTSSYAKDVAFRKMVNKVENIKIGDDNGNNKEESFSVADFANGNVTQGDKLNQIKARKQNDENKSTVKVLRSGNVRHTRTTTATLTTAMAARVLSPSKARKNGNIR